MRWRGFRGEGSGVGLPSMKGDGEEKSGFRDFLSLGSTTGSVRTAGEGGSVSGRGEKSLLSSLSRNGLSMLAGRSNGFSLKPLAVGNLSGVVGLRNLGLGDVGERATKVSGSGFSGFYRASVGKTAWPSAPTGLRFVRMETQGSEEGEASSSRRVIAGKLEQPLRTDVENLSRDECWRLILRLGEHWPWISCHTHFAGFCCKISCTCKPSISLFHMFYQLTSTHCILLALHFSGG